MPWLLYFIFTKTFNAFYSKLKTIIPIALSLVNKNRLMFTHTYSNLIKYTVYFVWFVYMFGRQQLWYHFWHILNVIACNLPILNWFHCYRADSYRRATIALRESRIIRSEDGSVLSEITSDTVEDVVSAFQEEVIGMMIPILV